MLHCRDIQSDISYATVKRIVMLGSPVARHEMPPLYLSVNNQGFISRRHVTNLHQRERQRAAVIDS
jgi:hypothetical protein